MIHFVVKSVINAVFDGYRNCMVFFIFFPEEPLIRWLNFQNTAQKNKLQVLCELLKENIMNNFKEEMHARIFCHVG